MPIKSFEPFTDSLSLESIKNTVIGIDAEHYFNTLLASGLNPAFEALGGSPVSLEEKIISHVSSLKNFNIKPIFVLPGLKSISQYDYIQQNDLLPYENHLKQAWESINKNSNNFTTSLRDLKNPLLFRYIMDKLVIILQNNEIEFLISPFTQHHQLFYMWKIGLINCIFSSTDCLLFSNLENFILKINFQTNTFNYLENKKVLHDLNLNFKQFRDISMCVGNCFQPFQLINEKNLDFISLCQNFHDVYSTLSSKSDKLNKLIAGCSILDFCPVLKVNGRIEPLIIEVNGSLLIQPHTPIQINSNNNNNNSTTVKNLTEKKLPSKLIELFGIHLPDEFYFYQSIGLTCFNLVESFMSSNFVERLPIDVYVDPIYEKIVTNNTSLKFKEILINLFTSSLTRYFLGKKLILRTYYNGAKLHELDFKLTPPVYMKIKSLTVRHTTAKSFDIASVFYNLNDTFIEESTSKTSVGIYSNHEIISTSLLRTLIIYQFITEYPFKLSNWGLCLSKFIQKINIDFEISLLLFIFFKRLPDIDMELLSKSNDTLTLPTNEKYNSLSTLNLISKFSILFKIPNLKSGDYTGKVSQSLLHFHSIMNKLNTEIKDFITVNTLVLLFNNKNDNDKFNRNHEQWCSLASEIPFKSSLGNTLPGLIIEETIKTFINESTENFQQKLKENLSVFNDIVDNPVKMSLKILKFVVSICDIVELLSVDNLVKQNVVDKFGDIRSTLHDIIAQY